MRYLLLYNPVSGKGLFKTHVASIVRRFEEEHLSLDVYASIAEKDLEKQAYLKANDYDVFLVGGGDGTINEVVNGLMKSKYRPALGIYPSGTANDIAAILGIPRSIKKATDLFLSEPPVMMDINRMNDHYFVYTAASGLLTRVSYDISRRRLRKYGYLAYVFEGMKDFFEEYRYPVKITYDGGVLEDEVLMVLGLASNRVGGMTLWNFAHSKLNDGKFELRVFQSKKTFRRFRVLSFFLRRGKKLREDIHLVSGRFEIETSDDVVWNADGEMADQGSIVIEVLEQQIPFFVNPKIKKKHF
ncbi:MAG: YegS/Rv2252/BmrU family lipid kinase [Acholeplasmataceae bacterium]|nr:YegS/Rv2252/BmrU family lipid kinase [Acholeplasmataceae bacterium]